jgi:hypothetical protein
VWALAGALPAAAVAPIWSAYYYLFALAGMGLALGAWLARSPLLPSLALVALLGWGSEHGRRLEEFATACGSWTAQSHVNRFYLDRALTRVGRYLADLKRQRPTLPPRTTLFFSGVPAFLAWQAADGPLVRWAYRDSSLRSYFLSTLTPERIAGRPWFVFQVMNDTLKDLSTLPGLGRQMAISALLDDKPEAARGMLGLELERHPADLQLHYLASWVALANRDSAAAAAHLRAAGLSPAGPPALGMRDALALLAAGDSAAGRQRLLEVVQTHPLDPVPHAAAADALLAWDASGTSAIYEALAARLLAPDDPASWRRWAVVQGRFRRYERAIVSLRRYFELAGAAAAGDREAHGMMAYLRRVQPGGELVQKGLRVPVGRAR